MANGKLRILIADDHLVVRKGLSELLSKEKYNLEVVGEAGDGEEALQQALALQPDVILMDLSMPRMSGIESIHAIRKAQPSARILVLTTYDDDFQVAESIRAGAYGYLLKDTSPDELVHTIRSVYAEKLVIPQQLSHALLDGNGAKDGPPAGENALTQRELDVLRCLAQGMSNKHIAAALSIGVTTVRTHVSSLMHKLGLHNRTQLALYAFEHNLLN
jgi:DNA-binding NarL/FixJ family response regulator